MKKTDIIIAGGGFPGIYAAWRLAKEGKSVCLIDASDSLGGNMKSRQWKGVWLDNGMQNLDIRTDTALEFYSDILQDELLILDNHSWASTVDTTHTPGFEMPDFSHDNPQLARRALNELTKLENSVACHESKLDDSELTYLNWYENNYGASLCAAITPMLEKFTGGHTQSISANGQYALSLFSRPKLDEDTIMSRLKASSTFFDERVGVTLNCEDAQFHDKQWMRRFAYPAKGGLGGFCKNAESRLRELGVDIQYHSKIESIDTTDSTVTLTTSNQIIEGNKLLWTLSEQLLNDALKLPAMIQSGLLPIGYCIFAFEVPENSILGPDYLHDFEANRLPFRYSKPGVFSQQTSESGNSVILAEVPAHPSDQTALLNAATTDTVWADCIASGYVDKQCSYIDATSWKIPVAFALQSASWTTSYAKLESILETQHSCITAIKSKERGRSAFINTYETRLHEMLT